MQILDESSYDKVPRAVKFIETDNRVVVLGVGEGESGELLFSGYRVSALQVQKCWGRVAQCERA